MDRGPFPEDILAQGGEREPRFTLPGWRPSRAAGIFAVATLLVGLAVGYTVGKQHISHGEAAAHPTASPTQQSLVTVRPATPLPLYGPALTEEPGTCSTQVGQELELGIPVTNMSPDPVVLYSAKPELDGFKLLKVLSWQWATCGYDGDGITPDAVVLEPGETTWLTVTVKPLVVCPAPAPMQFLITYSVNQQDSSFMLPGFPDLGSVRYSGCKGHS